MKLKISLIILLGLIFMSGCSVTLSERSHEYHKNDFVNHRTDVLTFKINY